MTTDAPINPDDRRYTTEHLWVSIDPDGIWTVGPTWFLHEQVVGPIHIELPDPGEEIEAGETIGHIQSLIGAMRELYGPANGIVTEIHEELVEDPELMAVYDDPYGDGWLLRMRPHSPGDADGLLTASEYSAKTPYAKRWQITTLDD